MTTHPRFWLTRHVHLCITGDGVVLLDLKRDKYVGLGGAQLDALCLVVAGWPVRPAKQARGFMTESEALPIAEKLVAEGVLTRDSAAGKSAQPLALESVDMVPVGVDAAVEAQIRWIDIPRFIFAYVSAVVSLRWGTFASVVARAEARRVRQQARAAAIPSHPSAEELTVVFSRLRTYVYTRKDRCLVDALTLVNFLAQYGHYPMWVVGIRTRPFRAHSWVQHGSLVFDASPDYICEFTPILAV